MRQFGYFATNRAHGGNLKSKTTTTPLRLVGICLIAAGLIPLAGNAETPASSATLTVIVDGIPSIEGAIKIQLLREGKSKTLHKATAPVTDSTWTWVQKDLPYGNYRIKVFHDQNANDELDTGMWGIPTEAYGFSNNARGVTGPPDDEETLFPVQTPEVTQKITLQ